MEHAQARAQLNAFRHQDALVIQEVIARAETEKQAVMRQLEGVVKHERTQIMVRLLALTASGLRCRCHGDR